MEKILLINKPKGKSSFWVVKKVKEKYPGQKVGHAGTLDPLAEGLLIVLVGKATKKQKDFENLDKEYIVEAILGATSLTYDLEGELEWGSGSTRLISWLKGLTEEKINKVLEKDFSGRIVQTVPAFSAIKVKGQRLYWRARKGKPIAFLPKRTVELKKLTVLKFTPASSKLKQAEKPTVVVDHLPRIKIKMTVSKGFYIRSFVSELGEKLKTGAVVSQLARTQVGKYLLVKAVSPKDILANGDRR